MADETNEGFLAGLPFIGSFFKDKAKVIDTPFKSTPIPDSGSLDTTPLEATPMVVLPDEPPAKAVNSPPTSPPTATPEAPAPTPSTTKP